MRVLCVHRVFADWDLMESNVSFLLVWSDDVIHEHPSREAQQLKHNTANKATNSTTKMNMHESVIIAIHQNEKD